MNAPHRCREGQRQTQVPPGRLAGMLSRLHVAGGQRGRGQRRVAHTREVLAQLGGLESGVGRRPSRTQFTLVGEREGQALQAVGLVQHFLRRLGLVHHLAELGGGRGQLPRISWA